MPRPRRHAQGYTALAVLVVLAAAMVFAWVAIEAGRGSRVEASNVDNSEQARAIAEVGMERTRAYLAQVLATQVDFDRALDPKDDTVCTAVPFTNTADDGLPPFADGTTLVAGPANKSWTFVQNVSGGSYLVRIDDDDDDQLNPLGPAVNDSPEHGCLEGASLLGLLQNPARDTNRTVVVTAVGIYPGNDPAHALATRTLRATVGAPQGAGLVVGGPIDLSPASDDVNTSVIATGAVNIGSESGTIQTSSTTCSPAAACQTGVAVPTLPRVDPWDVSNAPSKGSGINFYFAAFPAADTPALYQWNYGVPGCADPRAFGRICYPTAGTDALHGPTGTLCSACWTSLAQPTPGSQIVLGGNPIWDVSPHDHGGSTDPGGGCDTEMAPSTWTVVADRGPDWTPTALPRNTFKWNHATHFTGAASGIWFVAGNVEFDDSTTCSDAASIIALGDITTQTGGTVVNLLPVAPKSFNLLAGRDLELHGGHGGISSVNCAAQAVPAAVLVHEQADIQSGDNNIADQLVVQNAATCSGTVTTSGLSGHGNDDINVPFPPPVGVGSSAVLLDYQESSF